MVPEESPAEEEPARRPRVRRRLLGAAGAVLVASAVATLAVVHGPSRPTVEEAAPSPTPGQVVVHVGGRPMRVLFAGDSLTFGSFASTHDLTFRALVMKGVRHHAEATNDAVGGAGQTSAVVVKYVRRAQSYDLVVVETGTNDAKKESPELLRPSYKNLLSALRRQSAGAALVCVGSWLGPQSAPRVDEVVRSECTAAGGMFVEVSDLYRDGAHRGPAGRPTEFGTSDDFHPNDAGHQAIADRILAAVRIDKLG